MAPEKKVIHDECLKLCNGYTKREAPIVLQLQKVGETKLYRELNKKNLFQYAVDICGLSEGTAYSFISVGKAAQLYPELKEAIVLRTLTVSKAIRIVSILNPENATELVTFAKQNTSREIEREVRRRNPKASVKAKIKPLDGDTDLLTAPIARKVTANIERAQDFLAQKTSEHQGIPETIEMVFEDFVERQDPVRKAERAQKRKSRHPERSEARKGGPYLLETNMTPPQKIYARAEKVAPFRRIPLTAEQKHIVDLRDQRKCRHVHNGRLCSDGKWIHYHHIVPVANGGTNDPSNITTLCSFHHDLVHQLSLAIEGQVTWLRSPRLAYG